MLTQKAVRRQSQRLLHCAVFVAVGAVGCASDEGIVQDDSAAEASVNAHTSALQQETSGGTTLSNGVYFADVQANGTGCPPGTWHTEISSDGKVFTTTFSQYEVAVDQNKSFEQKNCQLSIKLRSPSGLSYAVSHFSYGGYAFLEQNVSVNLAARYYFQGVNVGADSVRTLTGPYDDSYLYEDEVKTEDFVWSPCGAERDLQIPTRLRMANSDPRGSGYTSLAAIDARTESKIIFQLNWRECK